MRTFCAFSVGLFFLGNQSNLGEVCRTTLLQYVASSLPDATDYMPWRFSEPGMYHPVSAQVASPAWPCRHPFVNFSPAALVAKELVCCPASRAFNHGGREGRLPIHSGGAAPGTIDLFDRAVAGGDSFANC